MQAADLFREDIIQIFSLKTGDYLGYIRAGEEMPDEYDQPIELPEIKPQTNQLKLF